MTFNFFGAIPFLEMLNKKITWNHNTKAVEDLAKIVLVDGDNQWPHEVT